MSAPLKRDGASERVMARRAKQCAAYHADLPANRAIGRAKAARRRTSPAYLAYRRQWAAAHRAELADYYRRYRKIHPGRHRKSILGREACHTATPPPIRVRTETSACSSRRRRSDGR